MKKFLVRVERALVRVLLAPELRPLERAVALPLARSVLVRVGASSAVVALAVDLIDRYVV